MSHPSSSFRRLLSWSILAVVAAFGGASAAEVEAPAQDAVTVRNRLSDSSERGVGFGDGCDIEADRAYAAVSPGGAQVATPAPGQTVFFHTDWFVSGSGGSQTYLIRALLDGSVFCTGSATLESGSFTIWCNDGWRATSGLHTLRWEIDYTDKIAETDEGNNSSSRTWAVGSLLDVAAVGAFLRTAANGGDEVAQPTLGQPVFLHLRLQASGFAGDLSVSAQARLDGAIFCGGHLTVQAGTRVVWCNESWNATAGNHTLQWVLDPSDVIAESDELNNGVFAQWTTTDGETPTPTDTKTPSFTPTPTRTKTASITPTRTGTSTPAVASATPTPTGTVLAFEDFYGRGDGDCSLTLTAADVLAEVRGLAGESLCDNDDCDRDGVVTAADIDCAARCIFGECPVPPHAPRVISVAAESAPDIVPISVIRITGTEFGPAERLKGVIIGGLAAEIAEFIPPDTILAVVPSVRPGPADLVVLDGDLAGSPFPILVAQPQPIAPPDTFADFVELLTTLLERFEKLDLEEFYGTRTDFIRGELLEARRRLLDELIELLSDPRYTPDIGTQLDRTIDSSGVPELLRSTISDLEALGEGDDFSGAGAVGGTTVIAVAGVTKVAGATVAATGATISTPVWIAIPAVAFIGGVIAAAVTDVPTITKVIPDFPQAGASVEIQGDGFGTLPPLPKLRITSRYGTQVVPAEGSEPGLLRFRVPDAVGLCGQTAFTLTRLLKEGNTVAVKLRPVLNDLSAEFTVPGEELRVFVRGVAGCAVEAEFRQDEGEGLRIAQRQDVQPVRNQLDMAKTSVPAFVPGTHMVGLLDTTTMLGSAAEKPLTIGTALEGLAVDCDLQSTGGVVVGATVRCAAKAIPSDAILPELGAYQYQWTVPKGEDLVEVREVAGFQGRLINLTGKLPGIAELSVVLHRTDVLPLRFIARSSENATISFIEWNPPMITLQTESPEIVAPGAAIKVLAKAEDDFEMQKIVLRAEGDAVPEDLRVQEYDCPSSTIPGVHSRKCEYEFQFRLKENDFRPGPITISAFAIDAFDNAGQSNQLFFRFALGEVTGTVFDADSGDPIQDVILQLLTEGGTVFDTVVSGGGGFLFEDVPAATYTLTAVANGFEPGQAVVVVEADRTRQVDIFLEPLGPITVELRKIAESPPSSSNVRYARSAIEDGTVVYTFFDSSDRDSTAIYVNRGAGNQIVADTTNIIPDTERTFSSFGDLALDGDIVAFTTNLNGRLYRRNLNVPNFPEAVEEFLRLPNNFPDPFIMVYDGGRVGIGLGNPSTSSLRAIYTAKDGGIDPRQPQSEFLHLVADTDTAIPGGQGTFTVFRFNGDQDVAFEATGGFGADTIAFIGEGEQGQAGVYRSAGGGALEVIADTNTAMPDGLGPFDRFRGVAMDGGAVVFRGLRTSPVQEGIYMVSDTGLRRIANKQTTVPGLTTTFRTLGSEMAFDAGIVAFEGVPEVGVGQGVFIDIGGTLSKVLAAGDILDGKIVRSVLLDGDDNLDGDENEGIDLVMEIFFEDDSMALYVATVR